VETDENFRNLRGVLGMMVVEGKAHPAMFMERLNRTMASGSVSFGLAARWN